MVKSQKSDQADDRVVLGIGVAILVIVITYSVILYTNLRYNQSLRALSFMNHWSYIIPIGLVGVILIYKGLKGISHRNL